MYEVRLNPHKVKLDSTLGIFDGHLDQSKSNFLSLDPARIDILWIATIGCKYWYDSARNGQKITN